LQSSYMFEVLEISAAQEDEGDAGHWRQVHEIDG
jgi:hypothetical protein